MSEARETLYYRVKRNAGARLREDAASFPRLRYRIDGKIKGSPNMWEVLPCVLYSLCRHCHLRMDGIISACLGLSYITCFTLWVGSEFD